jgi:hypothetical protein
MMTIVLGYFVSIFIHKTRVMIEFNQIAWVAQYARRIRGHERPEDGWEPVATEGDEPIEMVEGRVYR